MGGEAQASHQGVSAESLWQRMGVVGSGGLALLETDLQPLQTEGIEGKEAVREMPWLSP